GPAAGWPSGTEVIDASNLTVLPGLIDCHDHLAFHGYELAKRWGLDEPRSTWHLRTAAVARQILDMGYTAIRDPGGRGTGLPRRHPGRTDPRAAPGAVSRDHLADRRARRPREPVGPPRAGRQRSVLAVERRRRRRGRADDRPHHGPRRRGRDQVRDDRRRQL